MPPAAPPTATTSGQAQQNLQSYTGGMQSPDQAMSAANAQFGVSQAQQTAQGLRSSLQNTNQVLQQVAPGVMGRTANSLVTSAQANRQIQNESAPIQTQLADLGQQEQNADSSYRDALSQAQNAANANLGFQGQHQSYLQSVYNDLYAKENADRAFAEQQREANMQSSAAANSGGSVASPSLGTSTATPSGMSRNAAGGYSFTNQQGQPITMGQYLYQQGMRDPLQIAHTAASFLSQGTASDKAIAAQINKGMGTAQLAQAFPQVFGGSY